jgi:DNA-binding transcriptional LysR family regulator
MDDWDDIRFFLAVARVGSIRGAATALNVNHSTVSRRLSAFEDRLGVRLFERFPTGYALTQAGDDLLVSAESVESELDGVQRRIAGKDAKLSGNIRVTMPDLLATGLLMPDIAQFCKDYPGIELDLIVSYETLNLTKREADVAIRVTNSPPEHLVGRRILSSATAIYASLDYIKEHDVGGTNTDVTWIGWDDPVASPKWTRESNYPGASIWGRVGNVLANVEATKAGMGISMLPCFLGDRDPDLRRAPPGDCEIRHPIWVLTHEDLRSAARIKVFTDYISNAIRSHRELLEGRTPLAFQNAA